MVKRYEYDVVDVFTQVPFEGNALAVFPDGRGLDSATMQRIARELNLSETTFLLPPAAPGGALRVRIFTPARELQFAGHPTVGTAFVARARGLVASETRNFELDEPIGLVPVRVDEQTPAMIWLTTPPIAFHDTLALDLAAAAAGVPREDVLPGTPCRVVSAGNPFVFLALTTPEAVDRAEFDRAAFDLLAARQPAPTNLFVFAPTATGAYSRMFAPQMGIAEDPATGSAAGPLAAFMLAHGLVSSDRFYNEQGTKMGRRSFLHVSVSGSGDAARYEVGGHVAPVATATMSVPL